MALLGARTQPLASLLRHCVALVGRHRCAEAQLVVVPNYEFLRDEDALAGDVDLAVSFLYVVALGLDITTQANLAAATVQHTPRRLTPEQYVRHVPAAMHTDQTNGQVPKVRFCLGPFLDFGARRARKRLQALP